jgi:membrane protease YdiL (CAAX protease family)
MLEILFALLVAVAMPLRAWRRHRLHIPPTPTGRYLAETLLLIAALAALLWRRGVPLDAIGLQPESPLRFVRDVAICLAIVVGLDVWSVWRMTRRIQQAPTTDLGRRAAALEAPGGAYGDALAARVALAPFVAVTSVGAAWEELCFRATVFLLVPRTAAGVLLGIVAGSLVFGAQHLRNGRSGMAYASFFGLMFSLLYLGTGNLIAVIISHAVGNILSVAQWAPRIERARQAALQQQSPMFLG